MSKARRCLVALAVVFGCLADARGETLRGNVLSEDGSPAKGAHVWAVKLWIQSLERVETTADREGRFSVELGPGQWLIEANLGDQGIASMENVQVATGQAPTPVTVRLIQQGRLRARLVEAETGKPIAGGRLVLDNGLDPVTDREGRFEVGGLSGAEYHESFVVAPGRERKRVLFEMSEKPVTDLEIPVPRGGKARGCVLDMDRKPIAGAFVGRSTSGSIISLSGLWVRADDQGRFEFDGLPLDRITWLNAVAEGYEDGKREGVRSDADNGPLLLEFRLRRKPGARGQELGGVLQEPATKVPKRRHVSGVVLDAHKKPVVGALVRWGWDLSRDTIETKTDAAGAFRLAFVPDQPGVVNVIPAKSDLAPHTSTIRDDGDRELAITLKKAHAVTGVVRDDQGTVFAGVTIVPIVAGDGQRGLALWQRSTKTDALGRFAVSGLPESGTSFTFLREGVSDLRDHVLELDKDHVVIMTAAGAIRGKVLSSDGKPVRNFRVLLNGSREEKPDDKHGGFFAGFCGIGLTFSSYDGSFLIKNLTAGSVQRVTVLAPGHGEGSIDRVIAQPINRLTAKKPFTFRLAPAHNLKARVLEETSGKPVTNARLTLIDDPSVEQNVASAFYGAGWSDSVVIRTDKEGVATFSPLTYGEGTILVQAAGFAREHLGWHDRATKIDVTLAPEAVVSGELFDASTGKPMEGVSIQLSSPTGGQFGASVQPGDGGRFRIGELPAGKYILSITRSAGAEIHQEQLALEAGRQVSRLLRLSSVAPAATP